MTAAGSTGARRWRRPNGPIRPLFVLALGGLFAPLALAAEPITWPRDLYNPVPKADDVLLPLPCGGAMAFRWVPTADTVPADVPPELAPLFRLVGPFEHAGGRALLLGKYEVSRRQYATRAALTGGPCAPGGDDARVAQGAIGWYDALGFAAHWTRWLATQADRLPDCGRAATLCVPRPALVRLPTEAEWEYSARGGRAVSGAEFTAPRYPMDGGLKRHAWYADNSDRQVKPLGQRAANPLGVHDLYGNVEELTIELYRSPWYLGQRGAAVIRGGSIHTNPDQLDAAARNETPLYGPGGANRAPDNGLRLLVDLAAPAGGEPAAAVALPAPSAQAAATPTATGQLQVDVDTPAEVRIDGRVIGQAAPGVPVRARDLAVGDHRVEVRADGYQTVSALHPVTAGRWTQVVVEMPQAASVAGLTAALTGAWETLTGLARRMPTLLVWALGLAAGVFVMLRVRAARRGARPLPAMIDPPGPVATSGGHVPTASAIRTPTLLVPRLAFEPQLIALPGGTFLMGSPANEPERSDVEGPQHPVRIAQFAIGKCAVTFAQYDAFCAATGRQPPGDHGWGRGKRPVINVSWKDAVAYAVWLSKETGEHYRLPTEAEWEYAARAGTTTPFWTGRCITSDQANYNGNHVYAGCGAKTGVYRKQTVPVGNLPANPWGLHEVHGNVWEWVQDRYHASYQGEPTDGRAWEAGGSSARVVRGGSW
ncbi:MAG: SUMF1/EgtB/PvdO family nonheme iron enzyme, partial [Lamprocystis purpurea]|nr:SUMF1/EgtB/PvdO family nonheme iron enzyme [Lamprocystis purpurea]